MLALYVLNLKEFFSLKRKNKNVFSTKFENFFIQSHLHFNTKKEVLTNVFYKEITYPLSCLYQISKDYYLLTVPICSGTKLLRNILPHEVKNDFLFETKINRIKLVNKKTLFLLKEPWKIFPMLTLEINPSFTDYLVTFNEAIVMRYYSESVRDINLKAILEELDANIIRLL